MPTTYTPIASTTLGSAQSSITLNVGATVYTDLIIKISAQGTSAGNDQDIYMRFNSDTGANYSRVRLYGNGTSALQTANLNQDNITIGNMPAASSSLGLGNSIVQIMNYSNTNIFKSCIIRTNTASTWGTVFAISGLWRNTAAITSITFTPAGGNFAAGSTFALYGIASAAVVNGAKATGGDTITTDGTYWYHAFRASGTFTPTQALTADILTIAGGGAAGASKAGGGGAGGVVYSSSQSLISNNNYTITVGAGGTGLASGSSSRTAPNGSNSQFGSLTAAIGGGGGGNDPDNGGGGGGTGGSGGGGSRNGYSNNKGLGTVGQGNNGGDGKGDGGNYPAGGGGGAGAVGQSPTNPGPGGNGGVGTSTYSSWGLTTGTGQNSGGTYYYAGGGGGSTYIAAGGYAGGSGGLGGGGAGSGVTNNQNGTSGTVNTGGGGGGTDGNGSGSYSGGNGGSGLIIVRYPV